VDANGVCRTVAAKEIRLLFQLRSHYHHRPGSQKKVELKSNQNSSVLRYFFQERKKL